MNTADHYLQEQLGIRRQNFSERKLPKTNKLIDFCSNDYLGFAQKKDLKLTENVKHGSTGSRLISGNSSYIEDLEYKIAEFHKEKAGLFFNSGFVANLGLLSCIARRTDTILYDELSHASIRDGIRLSPSRSFRFKHNDISDLKKRMPSAQGNIFIVVESIYSMDGDAAPLEDLVEVSQKYNASLIVDEAHATGVFGQFGEGLINEKKLEQKIWARVHTFGKALGGHGAIVLGSELLRQFLINFSRPFIYTTALPEVGLKQIEQAYAYLPQGAERSNLLQNINFFLKGLPNDLKGMFIPSQSAIQCLIIPGNKKVKWVAEYLQQNGFDVRPILSPTVPQGQERLRICLHSFNTQDSIKSLTNCLNDAIKK